MLCRPSWPWAHRVPSASAPWVFGVCVTSAQQFRSPLGCMRPCRVYTALFVSDLLVYTQAGSRTAAQFNAEVSLLILLLCLFGWSPLCWWKRILKSPSSFIRTRLFLYVQYYVMKLSGLILDNVRLKLPLTLARVAFCYILTLFYPCGLVLAQSLFCQMWTSLLVFVSDFSWLVRWFPPL